MILVRCSINNSGQEIGASIIKRKKLILSVGEIMNKRDKRINFGIRKDLSMDIRFEPNACRGYVLDVSLGCPHHCIYCLFAPLENRAYRLMNPSYKDDVLKLNIETLRNRKEFPPVVYMCYSSDPLGSPELAELSCEALEILLKNNVNVLFITKGIFTDKILDIIREYPSLMNVQVDVSNCDSVRNMKVEPGAPSYEVRLDNLRKLSEIKGLASLSIRMDPLLPDVDDADENVRHIFSDMKELGITEAIVGYLLLTKSMKKSWERDELLSKVSNVMTEVTPTISGQELFSIPYQEKIRRISLIRDIAAEYNINIAVCGCKDERFKSEDIEWVCHPYNRNRRLEIMASTDSIDSSVSILEHFDVKNDD